MVERKRLTRLELLQDDPRYRPARDAEYTEIKTLGWKKACGCATDETMPCIVLDPFGGAGTTGMVAKRLRRDYVLIELNPAYVEMAQRRIDAEPQPML